MIQLIKGFEHDATGQLADAPLSTLEGIGNLANGNWPGHSMPRYCGASRRGRRFLLHAKGRTRRRATASFPTNPGDGTSVVNASSQVGITFDAAVAF